MLFLKIDSLVYDNLTVLYGHKKLIFVVVYFDQGETFLKGNQAFGWDETWQAEVPGFLGLILGNSWVYPGKADFTYHIKFCKKFAMQITSWNL